MKNRIKTIIEEAIAIKEQMYADEQLLHTIESIIDIVTNATLQGKKILFCGNGGSAADAQHLAAELSNKFYLERRPIYAEALHCNTSYITAAANDFDFEIIYSRLLEGIGKEGDVLIALSTSGTSKNIINAISTAKKIGVKTILFTGTKNRSDVLADIVVNIPSKDVARIQEAYMLLGHIICKEVEERIAN